MFGLEKIFAKQAEAPQKGIEQVETENKELIKRTAREIAEKILKDYENRPADTMQQNSYLERLGRNADNLAKRLEKDCAWVGHVIKRPDLKNKEIIHVVDGNINQDKESRWTAMVSFGCQEVLENGNRKLIPDTGILNRKPNLETEKEGKDWLEIRTTAFGEITKKFGGDKIEETEQLQKLISKE